MPQLNICARALTCCTAYLRFLVSLLVLTLFCLQPATAETRGPHIFYRSMVNNQVVFSSPGAVYGELQAFLAANEDPSRSTTKFLDLYPVMSEGTVNGSPKQYQYHYRIEYADGSESDLLINGGPYLSYECPKDFDAQGNGSQLDQIVNCVDTVPSPPCECKQGDSPPPIADKSGNPIFHATGIKQEGAVDYAGAGANELVFSRQYRSSRAGWSNGNVRYGVDFSPTSLTTTLYSGLLIGTYTGQIASFPYYYPGSQSSFAVVRGATTLVTFSAAGGGVVPTANISDRLTTRSTNGVVTGWDVYNASDESTETYNLAGQLTSLKSRNGRTKTYLYSDSATPAAISTQPGQLIRVTDQFGRQLNFKYSGANMTQLIDPAGQVYLYGFDEASSIVRGANAGFGNLTSVTYPDGKKRVYWYNEPDKTSDTDLPYALTGITDENGVRFATFTYNTAGKAISTEHAGGADKYLFAFPNPFYATDVTDPLGTTRHYTFEMLFDIARTRDELQPDTNGGSSMRQLTYDANGNMASSTDFNGVTTTYSYDLARNLETARVEAAGTPQARTITTSWHASYRLPLKIAEPKLLTTLTYDASGNLLTRRQQATTDTSGALGLAAPVTGVARSWSWTYNGIGQVLTATGPRTDVVDRTTYVYDSASGNLTSSTNAASQVTTFNSYDANGRLTRMTDPNGVVTTLTYAPRGWLLSSTTQAGAISEATRYTYDAVGQLTGVTLPDASVVHYGYDDAHRLTSITDNLGNRIAYTLDNMGNRINETVSDPGGVLARQTSRSYDALNRLQQVTGGVQ